MSWLRNFTSMQRQAESVNASIIDTARQTLTPYGELSPPLTDTDSDDSEYNSSSDFRRDALSPERQPRKLGRGLAPYTRRLHEGPAGLEASMKYAKRCKVPNLVASAHAWSCQTFNNLELQRMQECLRTQPAEALIAFIHACYHSTFAVSFLKRSVNRLIKCIDRLEENIASEQQLDPQAVHYKFLV